MTPKELIVRLWQIAHMLRIHQTTVYVSDLHQVLVRARAHGYPGIK